MSIETESGGVCPAASKPAFLRELEALRAQRQPPSLERDYTIGGSTEQTVHREVNEQRESRIADMEARFREMRGHASNEFGVSQQRDVPSRAFERSR